MKLQFKHQKFQADAAKAVVDVFRRTALSHTFLYDGSGYQLSAVLYRCRRFYRLAQRAYCARN